MVDVFADRTAQMRLIQDSDVVQRLSPATANPAFRHSILRRAAVGDSDRMEFLVGAVLMAITIGSLPDPDAPSHRLQAHRLLDTVQACEALGCVGYARVAFDLDHAAR